MYLQDKGYVDYEKIKKQDFGVVINNVITKGILQPVLVTEPSGMKLSDWRNIAYPHTYSIDNTGSIKCTYGKENKNVIVLSMQELENYAHKIIRSANALYIGGPYERMIKNCIVRAWEVLKRAPLILNAENMLVPAMKGDTPNIYLGVSSKYKSVGTSAIVNTKMASEFERLLEDGFGVTEYDNFQYIKEKVIKKYINVGSKIGFEGYSADYKVHGGNA